MYEIIYHPLVAEDFKKILKHDLRKIIAAILKKLRIDPFAYGKALSGELKGYFRLRVGQYRVIYRIEKERVVVEIIKIGIRKDLIMYLQMAKRLKKMDWLKYFLV